MTSNMTEVEIRVRVLGDGEGVMRPSSFSQHTLKREIVAHLRVDPKVNHRVSVADMFIPEVVLACRALAEVAERAIQTDSDAKAKVQGVADVLDAGDDSQHKGMTVTLDGVDLSGVQEWHRYKPGDKVRIDMTRTGGRVYDGTVNEDGSISMDADSPLNKFAEQTDWEKSVFDAIALGGYVNMDSLATEKISNMRDVKERMCDLVREMGRNPIREDSHFREGWRAFAMNLSSQVMDLFIEMSVEGDANADYSIKDVDDETILVTKAEEPRHQGIWKRVEEDSETCNKVLVGQGDDSWDPMCGLPAGHKGPCSAYDADTTPMNVAEEVIEAVTSAILNQNARPGPKLTHFMARLRAKAAIKEYRKHMDESAIEEARRLQDESLDLRRQLIDKDEVIMDLQDRASVLKVAGTCPACGSKGTLFLGEGGYVTCSWSACKDPGAADKLLHNDRAGESMKERLSAIHSLSAPEAPSQ